MCNGTDPCCPTWSFSAPADIRSWTTSTEPLAAAACNGLSSRAGGHPLWTNVEKPWKNTTDFPNGHLVDIPKNPGQTHDLSSLILSNSMRKWDISNIYLKSLTYYNFSWHVLIVRFTRRLDPLAFVPSFSTAICLVDSGTSLIQWGSDRFVSLVSFGMSKTCRNYSTTT